MAHDSGEAAAVLATAVEAGVAAEGAVGVGAAVAGEGNEGTADSLIISCSRVNYRTAPIFCSVPQNTRKI